MKELVKKVALLIITLLISSICLSLQASDDKPIEHGSFAINVGATYGFELEKPGISVGLGYMFAERSRLSVDLTNWLIDDPVGTSETRLEFYLNYNIFFVNRSNLVFYGILGFGYHYAKFSFDHIDDRTRTDTGVGVGVGLEYNFGRLSLFGEPKIVFLDFDDTQIQPNIGLRFYLN